MARASRRMAASLNLLPWFETARIAAKCTQAAPAMAHLLTMRPSVLERDTPEPPTRCVNPLLRMMAPPRGGRSRVRGIWLPKKERLTEQRDGLSHQPCSVVA